jgi:hypothetical protein
VTDPMFSGIKISLDPMFSGIKISLACPFFEFFRCHELHETSTSMRLDGRGAKIWREGP